mmetsp:Transcript_7409/g.11778  ORF Transcript_7409/g.11778 Transcript_7409/m.11778 type:complete len:218 (+) Transcript_7409:179-832(+)|eukprot:CAMPEP_0184660238 /NCGR_PEP_ID=MMETSP0308-20130426/33005_1 /TAXON_ID=38269 /ORGANISM="Gloeochaete witrockiana, Strain SAG 46.84" /LENGTH=217 /DNA_ID=CAMNT_0027100661 /DNA_START=170 /DNA_END=823 /DNA_ORIENTATION=+
MEKKNGFLESLLWIIVLSSYLGLGKALYVNIARNEQKCFVVDVPTDTLVVGSYKSPDQSLTVSEEEGVRVIGRDPQKLMFFNHISRATGRFAFTSKMAGEHEFCMLVDQTAWMGDRMHVRFQLTFQIGANALDYEAMKKDQHMSDIDVRVARLINKVQDVKREQQYQKELHEEFDRITFRAKRNMLLLGLAQLLVLGGAAAMQMIHLRRFFEHKKLL